MNDPQNKYRRGTVSKNILLEGLNQFHGANLILDSDVDKGTFGKSTKHNTHDSQEANLPTFFIMALCIPEVNIQCL